MTTELRENEQKTLLCLKQLGGSGTVEQISETQNLAHAAVMRAALSLKEKGLIRIGERRFSTISLTDEGRSYAEEGLPERKLLAAVMKSGGKSTVDSLAEESSLDRKLFQIALGWLIRKGWATLKKGEIHLKTTGEPPEGNDEKVLRRLDIKNCLIDQRQ